MSGAWGQSAPPRLHELAKGSYPGQFVSHVYPTAEYALVLLGAREKVLEVVRRADGQAELLQERRAVRLRDAVHAHGTDGFLEADFHAGKLIGIQGKEETVLFETEGQSKSVENEMSHFLDCIENNLRPETDGPSSLQGLRVIWRMYEAEEKRIIADLRGLGLPAR